MRDSEPGRAGAAVQPSAWHTSAIRRRKFNTEGPVIVADHYCIPPLERVNLDRILEMIRDKRYFVVHAPRRRARPPLSSPYNIC